jgi:hypothetical protein
MSETTAFDVHVRALMGRIRTDLDLPEGALMMLEGKIRQVHADSPDLDPADAAKVALDVLTGEGAEARMLADHYEAEAAQARAAADRLAQRIEAMDRIGSAAPELQRIEGLYPGRSSVAEMLRDAGTTWEGVGLIEQDEAVLEELLSEARTAHQVTSEEA